MTNNYEKLNGYLEYLINDMESSITWAADHMQDETRDNRINWALWALEQAYTKGHGALQFSYCDADLVTKDEHDSLVDKLNDAYFELRDTVWERIK